MIRRFLAFVYGHQLLSWLGFVVGVVGLLTATAPLGTVIAWTLGVVGWGLATAFGLSLVAAYIIRPDYTVECTDCQKQFWLKGERGREAEAHELMRLRAHLPANSFIYSRIQMDGELASETLRYRNLGKDGKNQGQDFIVLGNEHVAYGEPDLNTKIVHIMPPGGLKRGDVFEVESRHTIENSFQDERESIGKNVLFPISKMTFEVEFSGCEPTNCAGHKIINDAIKELSPLSPKYQNGTVLLSWEVAQAQTDDRYRLAWDWAG